MEEKSSTNRSTITRTREEQGFPYDKVVSLLSSGRGEEAAECFSMEINRLDAMLRDKRYHAQRKELKLTRDKFAFLLSILNPKLYKAAEEVKESHEPAVDKSSDPTYSSEVHHAYNTPSVTPITQEETPASEVNETKAPEPQKTFTFLGKKVTIPNTSMEEVCGLENVKKRLNEEIFLPIKYPDIYAAYNRKAGDGILLYGPPGTGKTMLAKAIANKLQGVFVNIKCTDIMSEYLGESEKNIKKYFDEARKFPLCILFFDEFDAIGSKRDDKDKSRSAIINSLLVEMQGFEEHKDSKVICIAATNRPWMIDSALLRPGRFGIHYKVDLPNEEARKAIFVNNLRNVPHERNINYDKLAELTEGYNCADISDSIIAKMEQYAINRTMNHINGDKDHPSPIIMQDGLKAIDETKTTVKQSDLDQIAKFESGQSNDDNATSFIPEKKSNITFKDVAGLDDVKEKIKKEVIMPRLHPEIYAMMKKKPEKGILLYGLPGTGKTMIAKAIANELDADFFSVKTSDIMNKYVGQSAQNIRNLFDAARQCRNAVIFFDEFESLAKARGSDNGGSGDNASQSVITELLEQIQGTSSYSGSRKNNLLLIAATNCPWMIDSALLRPGRFGSKFRVDLPDVKAREYLIHHLIDGIPHDNSLNYVKMITDTEGFSGADITAFVEKAKTHAIDRGFMANQIFLTQEDIDYSLENTHGSISDSDIEKMNKFEAGNISDKDSTSFAPEKSSSVTFKDVAGLDAVKDKITKEIIMPRLHPALYASMHKKPVKGILLYGLPGTGKTMIAKAIANELGADFFSVKTSDIMNKYLGESEQNIRNLFDTARKRKNAIIFFDEFDSLAGSRAGGESSFGGRAYQGVITELLEQIQGTSSDYTDKKKNSLLIIAATNCPWMIDSALLRPGRIGAHFRIDLPDEKARLYLIQHLLKDVPHDTSLNYDTMVKRTEGYSGADINAFVELVKQHAIDRALESGQETFIIDEDATYGLVNSHSSIRQEDINNMRKFEEGLPH